MQLYKDSDFKWDTSIVSGLILVSRSFNTYVSMICFVFLHTKSVFYVSFSTKTIVTLKEAFHTANIMSIYPSRQALFRF